MVKPHRASGLQAIEQRHYDAAGSDGSIAGWQPASIAPEAETAGNDKLESRARDLFRNSPIARTIVESHVQQIMHGGISLLIQGESKQLEKIKLLVQNTIESTGLDTNKQSSFNELTALSLQETSTAGNCFALRVIDKSAPLGFRIKLLEYAYLDLSLNRSEGRNRIVRGTELDPSDCPVAYWLKPSLDAGKRGKSRRYSTDVIAHIFSPIRVGALGGVCWFAPAMTHIRMLDDILYSAQQRQATAQSFTAFVTLPHGYREDNADVIRKDKKVEKNGKGNPIDERGFAKSTKADSGAMKRAIRNDDYVRGLSEIRPNTFYLLRPGEAINLAEPPAPIDLASIIKPIVMFISKCTGLSYETILGDFSNGSYSATRMSNIQPVLWTKSRREMLKARFLEKVWLWIEDGLDTKGYDVKNLRHQWQFPEIVSAHPKEDLEMTFMKIDHNAGTISEYIRSTNRDPDMVFKERAEEKRKMRELELDDSDIIGTRSDKKPDTNSSANAGGGSKPRGRKSQ